MGRTTTTPTTVLIANNSNNIHIDHSNNNCYLKDSSNNRVIAYLNTYYKVVFPVKFVFIRETFAICMDCNGEEEEELIFTKTGCISGVTTGRRATLLDSMEYSNFLGCLVVILDSTANSGLKVLNLLDKSGQSIYY